jgi:hypothetical protein
MRKATFIAIALGAIAGALLIATTYLTTRGPMILIPYAAMLVAVVLWFRASGIATFRQRFNAAFAAFMTATLIVYVYLSVVVNPDVHFPLWDNVWPLLVMVAFGAIASSVVAAASRTRLRVP